MRLRKRRIEQHVEEILKQCDITGPPVPVNRVARVLGLEVYMQPFEGDLSGILIREGGKAILGVNSSHHIHRRRFTIAHEMGHFLLHEGNRVFVDRSYRVSLRSSISSLGTDLEEIEANTFASMILIPEQFLLKDLQAEDIDIEDTRGIERLARKYRVSPQTITFRLINRFQ